MLLQRIDGPVPLTAKALEGVGVSGAPGIGSADASASGGAASRAATHDEVRAAVVSANRSIQAFTQSLEFEVDPDTDKIVVRLVDTQDHRVLRQVPSQEMIEIARALDRMQTLLVRGKA